MNTPNPNLPAKPADVVLPNPHIESIQEGEFFAPGPEFQKAYSELFRLEQEEIAKGVNPKFLPMAGAAIRATELARDKVTDPMTGLLNRVGLDMTFERHKPEKFAVFFSDGRKFGEINKQYGHEVGDNVIKYIGENVAERIRMKEPDSQNSERRAHPEVRDAAAAVGRWGGDEILSVVDLSNVEAGQEQPVAEGVMKRLENFGTYQDETGVEIPIQIDTVYLLSDSRDHRTLAEFQTELDKMLDARKRPKS